MEFSDQNLISEKVLVTSVKVSRSGIARYLVKTCWRSGPLTLELAVPEKKYRRFAVVAKM